MSRILLAFLVAPLSSCVVVAALQGDVRWALITAPFAYVFSLLGVPAFFLFRNRGWLRVWQVIGAASALGALVSSLFPPGIPSVSDAAVFAAYGAVTGLVFWLVALARLQARDVKREA